MRSISKPALWRSWLLLLVVATTAATAAVALRPSSRFLLAGGLPDEIGIGAVLAEKGEILWIDARKTSDYDHAHVPGAFPLNDDDWDNHLEAILSHWQPEIRVVVYCDDSGCQKSRHVVELLRKDYQMGNAWVLHGGWEAWKERKKAE